MRFLYLPAQVRGARLTLGGGSIRYRPVILVRITGPWDFIVRDSLLDTGADETALDEWIASLIGADLSRAPTESASHVGRTQLSGRYATVELLITAMRETYRWPALVGFVPARLPDQILGHAAILDERSARGAQTGELVDSLNPKRDQAFFIQSALLCSRHLSEVLDSGPDAQLP